MDDKILLNGIGSILAEGFEMVKDGLKFFYAYPFLISQYIEISFKRLDNTNQLKLLNRRCYFLLVSIRELYTILKLFNLF
ncbi:TPA: hypothetical protein DCG82_04565 [candidate division WOR-3]|uniref:Uncharacterized protein n=1 Tax=candidate division WOR-3 bacterium TaxID=2052148 RepID=A0A348MKT1_UNCW3|nr:hypothetical protein [candidate division WOR-3 bacterium]HCP17445.1 hypothetical protein [candidate division WOR-3 bacterium]